jgi:UDP-glucuronate 4-epimerase
VVYNRRMTITPATGPPDATSTPPPLQAATIVVVGATGQVGGPVARALARDNQVWGAARFHDDAGRRRLEDEGVRCVPVDLAGADVSALPADVDYVLNFAVTKSNDWDTDLAANVGGILSLMEHHRSARAVLHCSTTAVYRPNDHHDLAEGDPLGDNHGVWPFLRTYSISKIAAEAAVRWAARHWDVPTTIARLAVPYGDSWGWPALHLEMMLAGNEIPVHENAPSQYSPIHEEDIVANVPPLLQAAGVPPTVVNWGGDEVVSIEDWCCYMGELTGTEPRFSPTTHTIESVRIERTKLEGLVGATRIPWRVGMRRMVEERHPEFFQAPRD